MKPEEIKKAIDFCNEEIASLELAPVINGCEMKNEWQEQIDIYKTISSTFDLINQYEAEQNKKVKEFAEKVQKDIFIKQEDERKQMLNILKTYRMTKTYSDIEQATDNWLRGYGDAVEDILGVFDNLLKEMGVE